MKKILFITGFALLWITAWSQEEYKKFYFPNGTLSSEGRMVDGEPDGLWKSYHPNGVLKSIGRRKNQLLDSTWHFYNEKGDPVKTIEYHLGKKNGYLVTYYVNTHQPINKGRKKSKVLYVNDKKAGMALYYREDGSIAEKIPYKDNDKQGTGYAFNSDGIIHTIKNYHNDMLVEREKINRYKNELKHGIWITFYDNDKRKREISYDEGKRDGYTKLFDRKGNIIELVLYNQGNIVNDNEKQDTDLITKTYFENGKAVTGSFKNGQKIGIHRVYEDDSLVDGYIYGEDGLLMENGLVNDKGQRNGKWTLYDEEGNRYAKGQYVNNLKSGNWYYFYDDNELLQKGSYKNGKPHGPWTWFYKDGDTLRYEEFLNGKENGYYVEYNSENEIIKEGYYINGEKDGTWYYNVGDISEEGKYMSGLKEGEWFRYYDNGQILYKGSYIQGNAEGKHIFYYSDGTIKEEQYYISGYKEGNWKKYSEDGEIIVTISYENDEEIGINGTKIELSKRSK